MRKFVVIFAAVLALAGVYKVYAGVSQVQPRQVLDLDETIYVPYNQRVELRCEGKWFNWRTYWDEDGEGVTTELWCVEMHLNGTATPSPTRTPPPVDPYPAPPTATSEAYP